MYICILLAMQCYAVCVLIHIHINVPFILLAMQCYAVSVCPRYTIICMIDLLTKKLVTVCMQLDTNLVVSGDMFSA